MKKIIYLIFVIVIFLSFGGCAKNTANSAQSATSDHTTSTTNATSNNDKTSTGSSPSVSVKSQSGENAKTDTVETQNPDIDISGMGSNVIYSKATEIASNYTAYLGKIIKIKGNFKVEKAQTRNYYYCLVADPTACCNAGFEFVLKDESLQYPNGYPAENSEFVVQGKLHTYQEGDKTYLELMDATIV